MNVPFITFLDLHFTEPLTLITDWMVAFSCFVFAHKLYKSRNENILQRYWAVFFLFIGLASFIGGVAHGFIEYVGKMTHYAAWILSSLAILSAQLATIPMISNKQTVNTLRLLACLELLASVIAIWYFESFDIVRINSAFGLLVVILPILIYHYQKNRDTGSGVIIIGILSNMIPGLIHAFNISYNQWFNANDISHLSMILCFYIMFKGATQIFSIVPSGKLQEAVSRLK